MAEEQQGAAPRRFRRGRIDVEIEETADAVRLLLDNHPVDVEIVDGKFHSQLAHPFVGFDDVDEIVERLVANEGRTWRLAHTHAPRPHHEGGQQ